LKEDICPVDVDLAVAKARKSGVDPVDILNKMMKQLQLFAAASRKNTAPARLSA
jgi:hypothetical protein